MKTFQPSFRSSVFTNATIFTIWWAIFSPGFFSTDSFSVLGNARNVAFEPSALEWNLLVKALTFSGTFPGFATLVLGLSLVIYTTYLTFILTGNNRLAAAGSGLLTFTPTVWGMGITLWRDIPFTSGMLALSITFIKIYRGEQLTKIHLLSTSLPAAILLTVRPNAFLLVLSVVVTVLSVKRTRSRIKFFLPHLLIVSVSSLTFFSFSSNISRETSGFSTSWMLSDISCLVAKSNSFYILEKNGVNSESIEDWSSKEACFFLNKSKVAIEDSHTVSKIVPIIWKDFFFRDPWTLFDIHLKRHSYLIPFPIAGVPEVPFLHTDIEFQDRGVSWNYPEVAEKLRVYPRVWNFFRGFFSWAGFWWLILWLLTLRSGEFGKRLIPLLILSTTLHVSLFITAPIPDGRYALFTLLTGQLALLLYVFGRFFRAKLAP